MRRNRYKQNPVNKNGKKFRSKFEVTADNYFSKKNLSYEYEKDVFKYLLNYIPDFKFTLTSTGKPCYIECKGAFPPEDRTKMLRVKENNPSVEIRFVFMRDNKLNRRSKTTYTMWADSHGFKSYVVGDSAKLIPDEWLKEFKKK